MRGLLAEIGLLVFAVVSVAVALVPTLRTRSRTVLILAGLLAIGLTIFQYYLIAYTGRGLFERAACSVFPGGTFCSSESQTERPPLLDTGAPYRAAIPRELDAGQQWGRFNVDGDCVLRFGNAIVNSFNIAGGGTCHYMPRFSPSPSGSLVIVLTADGDGWNALGIVDTAANNVLREATIFPGMYGFSPLDTWSDDERYALIGRNVGFVELPFHIPCVLEVREEDLRCDDTERYRETLHDRIVQHQPCVRQNDCTYALTVRSAAWSQDNHRFVVRYTIEYLRPAEDVPDYSQRVAEDETALALVTTNGQVSRFQINPSAYELLNAR